ncbi:MAG: hypothetical protein K5798_10060 [Nitrosopumilus sp.]|uniref:hypothetical protein n=1 Tax=Nitrosopumilus sp. TaxID=2024843 RepID=UPI00242F8703|nr:hypothetical protein [Nitrosopumilus sp.]MCV0367588.1 hypothetical protein [Nitrosopumilus sp.]
MKTRFLILVAIVLTVVPIGFFYYMSINGFSIHHAGIYVQLLSEQQIEHFAVSEPKTITQEELMQFPQISTMINLLLEEKENPQGTRSFFVNFDTYRIFDSRGELKIKNHMSDSGARNLYQDFTQSFESNVVVYEGNYFSITSWIA